MIPGKYDLKLYRGDSYSWQFKLWEDSASTVPLDLAGSTVAVEIRDKPSGSKIVQLASTITAPNIINVTLSAVACKSCPPKGGWDLQITFPDGKVLTPVAGMVTVIPDYTAST